MRQKIKWSNTRYKLQQTLGTGPIGIVYRADDLFLNVPVAVKVMTSRVPLDKAAITALKAEARTAMRLSHPHIGHLHNLDRSGEHYFLVTEYVPGSTLRALLGVYGYLRMNTVIDVLSICADALSYAHRHDVLHNDLKPENLIVTETGVLKIVDFGISCLVDAGQSDLGATALVYRSPEQLRGERLDARTDIYSLGMMTCEMLTGKTPFPADVTLQKIPEMLPVKLTGIREELRPILEKAVAPARSDRWESVESFVSAFLQAAGPLAAQEEA